MTPFSQSALHPAASGAARVAELAWLLHATGGLLLLLVLALLVVAIRSRGGADSRWWLVGGGVVLPALVLGLLLIRSLQVGAGLHAAPPADALRIEVTGRQWWWEVRYPSPAGGAAGPVVLANELHLPAGATIVIELRTADVLHSFWVPALGGKVDMVPGRLNRLVVTDPRVGIFRGQCAEFCGLQHAWMAVDVVVEPPAAFERWLRHQAAPARPPTTSQARQGAAHFLRAGCGECHAVRGTAAVGERGPDLTHVGSRRSLGAGRLTNQPQNVTANLAGWVGGAQDLKHGTQMPSPPALDGPALRAVTAYLVSLQ